MWRESKEIYSPECFLLLIELICWEKKRHRINEFEAGVTRVLVSKLYLFIKQRNVWYEVSLQHLSRHVSQHQEHMFSYLKTEKGTSFHIIHRLYSV